MSANEGNAERVTEIVHVKPEFSPDATHYKQEYSSRFSRRARFIAPLTLTVAIGSLIGATREFYHNDHQRQQAGYARSCVRSFPGIEPVIKVADSSLSDTQRKVCRINLGAIFYNGSKKLDHTGDLPNGAYVSSWDAQDVLMRPVLNQVAVTDQADADNFDWALPVEGGAIGAGAGLLLLALGEAARFTRSIKGYREFETKDRDLFANLVTHWSQSPQPGAEL